MEIAGYSGHARPQGAMLLPVIGFKNYMIIVRCPQLRQSTRCGKQDNRAKLRYKKDTSMRIQGCLTMAMQIQ